MTSTRRRITARTLAAAVAVSGGLALATPATASATAAPPDCNYMGYNSGPDRLGLQFDQQEQWMADQINAYRASKGVAALRVSDQLRRPTMWGSLDSAKRNFDNVPTNDDPSNSSHTDTRGMGIMDRAKYCGDYEGTVIGEIKYWGKGGAGGNALGLGPAALAWWKQSPGHNALMLDPKFTTYAVGWAYQGVNAELGGYWTVMFGNA